VVEVRTVIHPTTRRRSSRIVADYTLGQHTTTRATLHIKSVSSGDPPPPLEPAAPDAPMAPPPPPPPPPRDDWTKQRCPWRAVTIRVLPLTVSARGACRNCRAYFSALTCQALEANNEGRDSEVLWNTRAGYPVRVFFPSIIVVDNKPVKIRECALLWQGKTGMSRNRFDRIWAMIRFSKQSDVRPEGMRLTGGCLSMGSLTNPTNTAKPTSIRRSESVSMSLCLVGTDMVVTGSTVGFLNT
jgi:hypothetical protein